MNSWLIGKDPDAGKDWGQEEKGVTEDEMDGIIDSMNVNLSKLQEMVRDWEAWCAAVHGITKSWIWLGNWTTSNNRAHCQLKWVESRLMKCFRTPRRSLLNSSHPCHRFSTSSTLIKHLEAFCPISHVWPITCSRNTYRGDFRVHNWNEQSNQQSDRETQARLGPTQEFLNLIFPYNFQSKIQNMNIKIISTLNENLEKQKCKI